MSKINKALDYSKLLESQAKGKLLKKKLHFPIMVQVKYDGNYVTVEVEDGRAKYYTSGGLSYRHTSDDADIFQGVKDGVYLAERIAGEGKLGDRVKCSLRGPKSDQTSTGHTYKVFDCLTPEEYDQGYSDTRYIYRYQALLTSGVSQWNIVQYSTIASALSLEMHLNHAISEGYEGIMLYQPNFKWRDTKSRTVDLAKYKKRRTADLLVVDWKEGTGKYVGMIGSLILQDSSGRIVDVGSGLDDDDRGMDPKYWLDRVVEIEFEQIIDTYIQPTYLRIRDDKTKEDID